MNTFNVNISCNTSFKDDSDPKEDNQIDLDSSSSDNESNFLEFSWEIQIAKLRRKAARCNRASNT